MKNRKTFQRFVKNHTKAICSSKATILTLLPLLKPIKTDRSSVVDLDSLNITSIALLKCPCMLKQGPRSSIRSKILDKVFGCRFVQYCTVLSSTVQYCTALCSTVQCCTVLYSTVAKLKKKLEFQTIFEKVTLEPL